MDVQINFVDVLPTVVADALGTEPAPHPNGAPYAGKDFSACLHTTDPMCGFTDLRFGYNERVRFAPLRVNAGVRYGYDKGLFDYVGGVAPCVRTTFYDLAVDPYEITPVVWPAERQDTLKNHFLSIHTGTGDWADGLPWCP